jgi:amidase
MDPFASALEQGEAIRRGEVTALELAEAYLARIEQHNRRLNAFWLVTDDLARELAQRQAATGPLSGVSVSIKDLTALAGYPTTYGSRAFADEVSDIDYFVVSRLKEEGCVILGKTTTPEFGSRPVTEHGLHGAARNPWDLERSPGGSSGGAAAALAAGLCALSHGSDGGGSVRIPAACCGLVGLKPSRGRISIGPRLGEGWAGLSTQGVIARTVADAAAGLDAMKGHLPGDPYWAEHDGSFLAELTRPSHLRIAFSSESEHPVHPEIRHCVERVASLCTELGHRVEAAGPDTESLRGPFLVIIAASTPTYEVSDLSLLDPLNRRAFENEHAITGTDYVRAVNSVRAHSRAVVAFWEDQDVLITPTLTQPAPRVGEFGASLETAQQETAAWLPFTYPYNCTGQPAVSLPLGTTSEGLPIGVQLVGPPRGEDVILGLAVQLEEALPWRQRRPPGFD